MKNIGLIFILLVCNHWIHAQNRLALVIGNGDYLGTDSDLRTPVADAKAMANALRACGFTVIEKYNLDLKGMKAAIRDEFGAKLQGKEAALFYYSGHGIRYKQSPEATELTNYFIPTDLSPNVAPDDLSSEAIPMSMVIGQMKKGGTKQNILLLDACRSYPPSKSWFKGNGDTKAPIIGSSKDMGVSDAQQEFFISYATEEGTVANVGVRDISPYTEAVVEQLKVAEGQNISDMFSTIRSRVIAQYPDQRPYAENKLNTPFYFKQGKLNVDNVQYENFRQKGDSHFAQKKWVEARVFYQSALEFRRSDAYCLGKIADCDKNMGNSPSSETIKPDVPKDYPEIEMIKVEGGTFTMGSRDSSFIRSHGGPMEDKVANFAIGKYEVTQKEWKMVMNTNPSKHQSCDSCPVENVSYKDALTFIDKLNQKSGKKYRLPTEAEWEFAAKGGLRSAGHTFSGSSSVKEVGWIITDKGNESYPVGTKKQNELGIYDMTGNVEEWCATKFDYYRPVPPPPKKLSNSPSSISLGARHVPNNKISLSLGYLLAFCQRQK